MAHKADGHCPLVTAQGNNDPGQALL